MIHPLAPGLEAAHDFLRKLSRSAVYDASERDVLLDAAAQLAEYAASLPVEHLGPDPADVAEGIGRRRLT